MYDNGTKEKQTVWNIDKVKKKMPSNYKKTIIENYNKDAHVLYRRMTGL